MDNINVNDILLLIIILSLTLTGLYCQYKTWKFNKELKENK